MHVVLSYWYRCVLISICFHGATANNECQILGSVLGVSAGFVLGKEGPMVHTGSCVASLLAQGGSRKYGLTWNWIRYFKNDLDRRDLITCGAAAGVAAAFRAPVGGVLFALEEVTSW
jgi:chloride channel 7